MTTISVIGSGAWGVAMAMNADRNHKNVKVYAYTQDEYETLHDKRKIINLPDVDVPQSLIITTDLAEVAQANIILLAVPAQAMRAAVTTLLPHIDNQSYLILCSKGIELKTGWLMSQVVESLLPHNSLSVLSGPTFASEVAQGLPSSAVLAHHDVTTSRWLASSLSNDTMRLYTSTDIIGLQIAGALKNVIAIAAGIVVGHNFGDNARAAIISRGLQEIIRYGVALGAERDTFYGLAGIGDLVLTATSLQSRNYALGVSLGRQEHKKTALLTEGAYTAQAITDQANILTIDMPICQAVCNILHHNSPIVDEIAALWARPLKHE